MHIDCTWLYAVRDVMVAILISVVLAAAYVAVVWFSWKRASREK